MTTFLISSVLLQAHIVYFTCFGVCDVRMYILEFKSTVIMCLNSHSTVTIISDIVRFSELHNENIIQSHTYVAWRLRVI